MSENNQYPTKEYIPYSASYKCDDINVDLHQLKRDVHHIDKWCEALTKSLEETNKVNINLTKLISIHEQQHLQHEKEELELRIDIKELNNRLINISTELHERIDGLEIRINDKLDQLKTDLMNKSTKEKPSTEINKANVFIYMVIGGAMAIGWMIGNIDLQNLSKLIR